MRRAVVVGGGIIGTAVARLLAQTDHQVTLLEKEAQLARHQTGHNSGVVHAGLYYEPGSLKAQLCRRGVTLLREYAEAHDIAYEQVGKVVVARNESEAVRLAAIADRARANGVPDIRLLDRAGLAEIEPNVRGVQALHSPTTAIIDYPAVTRALAADVVRAGGVVHTAAPVTGFRRLPSTVVVESAAGEFEADLVVVCAGLQSDRLARADGQDQHPKIVPFFGDYHLLSGASADLCHGLVYPVPDPRYPFLGVHLTRHIDGSVSIGPDAFLSAGRGAYRRGDGASQPPRERAADLWDAVSTPGFWRFASRNLRAAARESRTAASTRSFLRAAQAYVPAINADDVRRGPRGIRAQAMNADGTLLDDFAIHADKLAAGRVVHVRNAPSPGATSAMAIAEHIVEQISL